MSLRLLPSIFGVIFLAWPGPCPAESLSWEQCVQETVDANPGLVSAQKTLEASRFSTKGARAGFFPQVKGSTGYQHVDSFRDGSSQNDGSTNGGIDGSSFGNGTGSSQYSSSLTLTQNIFAGFADTARVAQGKATEASNEAALQIQRAKVSFDLRSAFADTEYAQQNIKLSKNIAARRGDNLSIVKLRFEGGNENKGSYLLSQASLDDAKLDTFQAENALLSSQAELARVLGRSAVSEITVRGNAPLAPPPSSIELDTLALSTPQYLQATAQRSFAEEEVRIAESQFYPSLDLNSQLSNRDNNSLDGDGRFLLGINLSFPFYTGGRDYYGLKAAKSTLSSSSSATQSAAQQARSTITKAWNGFKNAVRKVTVNEKFVTAAEVRAEISRSRYNNGLLSFEDWDQIENDLINRQKNLLLSKRDRVVAEAAWEQAIGRDVLQ